MHEALRQREGPAQHARPLHPGQRGAGVGEAGRDREGVEQGAGRAGVLDGAVHAVEHGLEGGLGQIGGEGLHQADKG
ncbi:MAG: hypothetical protein ACK559_26630, partial [bacterium]